MVPAGQNDMCATSQKDKQGPGNSSAVTRPGQAHVCICKGGFFWCKRAMHEISLGSVWSRVVLGPGFIDNLFETVAASL